MFTPAAGIIGAAVTGLLMLVLRRTVLPSARQRGSRRVLEYGLPMRSLGIAMLLFGGVFLFAASRSSIDQRGLAWFVCGVLAVCSLYVFLEVFFVRVEFDESFIYPFSPWRGWRSIPWSDVVSCNFSSLNQWHVIRTNAHGTLRVSTFLSGIGSFLERLHEAGQLKPVRSNETPA
jgi:hypothetical protein